jgi:nucleoside-diphosphate-sugar epimerase
MTNIILLGGNGYIGREVTKQWLNRDSSANFFVVSRSGKNHLHNERIKNLSADVTDYNAVAKVMPEEVDYIVDFIGAPQKDPQALFDLNMKPAQAMKRIAEEKNVKSMGVIGGILGPKDFVQIKSDEIKMLQASDIPVAFVEPTLVYGAGRSDSMTKMVPMLKFLGIFSKKFKPVDVSEVARDLLNQLI